ncbi:MAG: type II secretion system protein GspM [Candidatus Deferrimicrobiaceae bacterium]
MTVAARIEARLRSLSTRERNMLLLCALVVVVFAVMHWVMFPAVAQHRKEKSLIVERRATLARYQAMGGGQSDVAEKLAVKRRELGIAEEGLLPGNDPSAAGAALQGMLKPMVNRTDTKLTSVRTLSPAEKGEYAEVAVQMDMQTSTEGLASFLAGIPRQQKTLKVKKLVVKSGVYRAARAQRANRADRLVVSLTVSGMTAAPEETATGGGEQ